MLSDNLLETQNITLSYNERLILSDISFAANSGKCLAILGQSGAGKSTLLKIMAGHLNPDSGRVLFRGIPLKDPREQLIRGHQEIKLVNQDFDLDMFHNVEENLKIRLPGYVENVRNQLIEEILDVVDLAKHAKQQVKYLSGGEQQRLALARALVQEPDVLLLDEPFVHLDAGVRLRIEHFVKTRLKSWNSVLVLVTHDGREAMAWADEIIFLHEGKIVRRDSPQAFYESPSNKNEALHFGPINEIQFGSKIKYFRPHAYHIVDDFGMMLTLQNRKFLGTHYENWLINPQNEHILLYSQAELPTQIRIQPRYVGEK